MLLTNLQVLFINNFNRMNDYLPVSHQNDQYGSNSQHDQQPHRQNTDMSNLEPNHQQYAHMQNPEMLGESQVLNINKQMNFIENDISENYKELRQLNNKITKSDLDHAHLNKLTARQKILQEKQKEYQAILANNEYMKQQMMNDKLMDSQIKHSLGNEYQQIAEERRNRQKEERKRQVQLQDSILNYNQQAMINDQQRKRQLIEEQKRQAQEELRQRQYKKQQERLQKQREKIDYNNKVQRRNQLQTQKDQVYRQYYDHFNSEQDKLQSIYKNRAMEEDKHKQAMRAETERKQILGFQDRMVRENEEKIRRMNNQRDQLRNYLKYQMQDNNRKKNRERQEEHMYQTQVKQYQVNQGDYQAKQRQRKRQEMKRYDEQLATQIHFRKQDAMQNSGVANGTGFAHRSSSMGQSGYMTEERRTHNPVTNPIDFKIGITNPYVIKQYEDTKEKYMGDTNLKLKNLAMVGNNSLVGHPTRH